MRLADQVQAWESPAPVRVAVSGAQPADAPGAEPNGDGARTRGTAGRRPALDSSQVMQPPQVRGHYLRRQRWQRRGKSAEFLAPLAVPTGDGHMKPVRPASCGWTIGQGVGIMHDGDRPAGYSGLERCGSIWACPHCGSVIRAGRAAEIEHAVKEHQKTGGELLFFTGTVRHHQGDDLALTLDAVMTAWRKMTGNRPWKRWKKDLGISGYIRSIEVTLGQHGWHPHAHVLLFLDGEISDDQRDAFRASLFELWADAVEKAGAKRPTEKGLDLQKVDKKGKVLAQYIGKIQDEKTAWSAGAELARADVKSGRGGSITPMELLDESDERSEAERARLWREFYTVTKGRRAITWSRGLKKRYDVGEQDDEEILDAAESTVLVWQTSAAAYRRLRMRGAVLPAIALELAEKEEWEELAEFLPPDKKVE